VVQQLKHLNQAAREHLNSPGHAWCVEAEHVKEEQQGQQSAIGLNVARIAHKGIRVSDSYSR
jgi:hypothetical protein